MPEYISKEISNFFSYYFEPRVQSRRTRVSQNDNEGESSMEPTLTVFNQSSHTTVRCKDQWLVGNKQNSTHLHVLINCEEVQPFKT